MLYDITTLIAPPHPVLGYLRCFEVFFCFYESDFGLVEVSKKNSFSTRKRGIILAFTRYCFTSRLYCTIIFFANTPFIVQYIAQYYQLLHSPAKS